MPTDLAQREDALAARFHDFIRAPEFPCVGAKSALAKGQMRVLLARDIASGWDDLAIWPAIADLAACYMRQPDLFQSLAVLFTDSKPSDEATFERHLWQRIQSLTNKDAWLGQQPDPRVSHDPENPHFSLSFGGAAFFVVGLHPGASRPARRFEVPAMIFNLHDQFEQLRAQGRYEKMRRTILVRDLALAGTENPMLARHGTLSEARQYSGRAVGSDWACPFAGRPETQNAL